MGLKIVPIFSSKFFKQMFGDINSAASSNDQMFVAVMGRTALKWPNNQKGGQTDSFSDKSYQM